MQCSPLDVDKSVLSTHTMSFIVSIQINMSYFIITICLLLTMLPSLAATQQSLTLPEALQYGLANSPLARNAALEENVARTRIGQAGSLALPQLSLNANYTRLDEVPQIDLGEGAFDLGSLDNYEVTAGFSQLLYAGGQVGAAWRAARITRHYATASRRAFEAALVHEITEAFHAVLLAREALNVQKASLEMLQAFEKQTRERQASGAASEFDALTARVRVANAKPGVIAARNQRDLAHAALATRINFKGDFEVAGELTVRETTSSLSELQILALQNRHEREVAQLRKELAREAIASARSDARPEIRMFANSSGGNANQFALSEDWEWRWNAGVTARWNFWDGNLTRQTIRQREIELHQQENLIEDLETTILLEVEQAWRALLQAQQSLEASAESVTLAERALAIAQTRYESGLSTYLELTDANLALRTAELTRLQAMHDHASATARIYFATGIPSPHLPPPNPHPDPNLNHPANPNAEEEHAETP